MIPYLGDFVEDDTVRIMFNTFTSDDPSASCTITNFIDTDVHVHKGDGLTQRNNAAGVSVSVDFDGITGSHMVKIDTSDDTVGGFWVTGEDYFVRIEETTIDGATVNAVIGHFSIENRYMRGTDSAALASALTTAQNDLDTLTGSDGVTLATTQSNYAPAKAGDSMNLATDSVDADALKVDAVTEIQSGLAPSGEYDTEMARITGDVALASVVGALNDAAAAGEVTEADTLIQYLKQLVNILIGTPGVVTFPAEAAPGDGVSLAEVIRAIHTDVTGLNGDAMVGTDGANTTVPDAAGTAAGLHATTDGKIDTAQSDLDKLTGADGATLATSQPNYAPNTTTPPTVAQIQAEMEEDGASILDTLRDDLADGGRLDLLIDDIKGATDNLPADPADASNIATAFTTTDGKIDALNDIDVSDITGVEIDNDGTPISWEGAMKLMLAVLTGKSSGGGTSTIVFRNIGDSKNRISATVDTDGNRTAIGTRDAT